MRFLFLLLALLFFNFGKAQESSFGAGALPEVSLGYKLSSSYKINTKIESFQAIYSNPPVETKNWDYRHRGTDIQIFASRKLNPFNSLAIGYQFGIEPGDPSSHRTIQQFSFVRRPGTILFGHRFRTDQTFADNESPEFRARYRLSLEIPLNGLSIDPGEFYLVASEEVIYGFWESRSSFENRINLLVGHYFRSKNKLQFGLDYRTGIQEDLFAHILWLKVGWYVDLEKQ